MKRLKNLNDLMIIIIQEIEVIQEETLHNIFLEIDKRLNLCISVKDNSFENYF